MFDDKVFNPIRVIKPDGNPFYFSRALTEDFGEKFDDTMRVFHVFFTWLTLFIFDVIDEFRQYCGAVAWKNNYYPSIWNTIKQSLAKTLYYPLSIIYYLGETVKWLASFACAIPLLPIIYLADVISKKIKASTMQEIKTLLEKIFDPDEPRKPFKYSPADDYFDGEYVHSKGPDLNAYKVYTHLGATTKANVVEKVSPEKKVIAKNLMLFFKNTRDNDIFFRQNPVEIPLTKENASGVDSIAQFSKQARDALLQSQYYDAAGRNPFCRGKG